MRAVFVNYCHPDTPHVCGVRVPSFARAMARRGHQVVLVTKTLRDEDEGTAVAEIPDLVRSHDWSSPLLITVRPRVSRLLAVVRRGRMPALVRRGLTAWHLVARGRTQAEWSDAARLVEQPLADHFGPQIVWATFLPTDALVIAARLAKKARCPWVADLKDSWRGRLPAGSRRAIAWKFSGAAGLTSNSVFHSTEAEPWFGKSPVPIYDGIDDAFLEPRATAADGVFRIVLVGSTYGRERLEPFLRALRSWMEGLQPAERRNVQFVYAGSDRTTVRELVDEVGLLREIPRPVVHGYLERSSLAALCAGAWVNAYLWLPSTFHHKLLGLLACGRPVIAFPGEHRESTDLALRVGGTVRICSTPEALVQALGELWATREPGHRCCSDRQGFGDFTWAAQAARLEQALSAALGERG
jgi:glycosyltransferase involved in cell wall biosynthesis